jgi:glutathione S-transferase
MERYRLHEWTNFIATEIHKGFSPLWQLDSAEDEKQRARDRLAKRFDWLAGQIMSGQFLMGRHFTIGDAYLFTVLSWSERTGISLGRWPVLTDYFRSIAVRRSVREALQAEGLPRASAATVQ